MKRLTGLTIVAWLAIIGGAMQVLGSLGLVGVGFLGVFVGSTGLLESAVLFGLGISWWVGILLITLGALGLVFGFGVLAEQPWSWTMGIALYGLNLLAGVFLILMTGIGWTIAFVTLLSAVILAYLFTPAVRGELGHEPGGGFSTHRPHAA